MAKKIGILTFHQALSYGAKLQAYALQNFLNDNGMDNEIVDYTCRFMYTHLIRPIRVGKKNKTKAIIRSFFTMKQTGIDRRKSIQFRNEYLKMSKPYTEENIASSVEDYTSFITGSDQVWSPTCVGFDKVYFLNFAKASQKNSYAASIGGKGVPDDKMDEYKELLSDYQHISVRENNGAEIVEKLTGKKPTVNVDPTLLLKSDKWDKIEKPVVNEPYIFLFDVLNPIHLIEYAKKLSAQTGLPIYYLQKDRRHKVSGVTYLDPVMANEFVGLIKHAEYVVTNSFHGTAFSVIYKKKFAVELDTKGGRNNRSEDLLNRLEIKNHEIKPDKQPDIDGNVDWNRVDAHLEEFRQESLDYLRQI